MQGPFVEVHHRVAQLSREGAVGIQNGCQLGKVTPIVVDPAHPFPRVLNKALCIGALLETQGQSMLGVATVPRVLPRVLRLPDQDHGLHFVTLSGIMDLQVSELFRGYQVDGVALASTAMDPGTRHALEGLPTVLVNPEAEGPLGLPTIAVDNRAGARVATEHLIELGHRHIVYLGVRSRPATDAARELGYRDAMSAAGLEARTAHGELEAPDASAEPGTTPDEEASLFGDPDPSVAGVGVGEESSLETSVALDDRLAGAQGGLDDLLEGGAGVGIRLNLNTMPRAVLEGLLPTSELPAGLVEDILHFRNEVDEEAIAEEGQAEVDVEAQALERALYGETFDEPMQFFASVDDLEEVPGWDNRLDDEQKELVKELVGTQSDVFSVHLWARIPPQDWVQEDRYEEPTGPVLRMRAIVWRRAGSEGTRFILIRPWHVVSRTRWTIPDFQWNLPVYEPPRW